MSSEYFSVPRDINFEKFAKNIKSTGITDITSFAMMDIDAIDPTNLGTNVLPPNSKGIVRNDGSSRLK